MFPNLSRRIAKLYKWLGLISIPILTIVMVISIANVFTRGLIANSQGVQIAWAIIFAIAIEVNIFRLFFEWKQDSDSGALWLGIGLVFVAGVALLIEGLQQSIGFAWSNIYVQVVIALVIALRVGMVIVLVAREGSRLGAMLPDTAQELTQPMYACLVQFAPPIDTPADTVLIQQIDTPRVPIRMINAPETDTEHRIRTVLKSDPGVSIRVLASKAGVSPNTAKKYKAQVAKEA